MKYQDLVSSISELFQYDSIKITQFCSDLLHDVNYHSLGEILQNDVNLQKVNLQKDIQVFKNLKV
jgi:hypothetical protein